MMMIIIIIERAKQVMNNAVAQHLLTNVQPVLKQWQPLWPTLPDFIAHHDATWCETSLW